MSYHNTPSSAIQSMTNAQGKTAPAGYHYMPDGSLMSDIEHARLYGTKIIRSFNLDTSDIREAGETRRFTITGDKNAVFSLEIREGINYYNFQTNSFQATKTKLSDINVGQGSYIGNIVFPSAITTDTVNGAVSSSVKVVMDTNVANIMSVGDVVTGNAALDAGSFTVAALNPDGDNTKEFSLSGSTTIADGVTLSFKGAAQYDFYLFSESNYGTKHAEYIEIRSDDDSIDINSSMGSNSNLVQKVIYQTLDVTLTLSSYVPNGTITGIAGTKAINIPRSGSFNKIPFSFDFTVTSTRTLTTSKNPNSNDVMAFITPTIGANPVNIPGEDIYPTVTGTDTVNGDFSSGATAITMDAAVATKMAVGDRITGTGITSTQETAVTVVSLDSTNVFTASRSIAIDDGITLSFSNRRNYRWGISSTTEDISLITPGMRQLKGSMFATQPTVKEYLTQTTILEGEKGEYKVEKVKIPPLSTYGKKRTTTRNSITKVSTTTVGSATYPINIVFSEQALLIFGKAADQPLGRIFGYGESEIERLTGFDVEFSDLAVTLTPVTTTTTAAVNSSTSVPITNRDGIMDGISTVKGVGINSTISGTGTVNGTVSASGNKRIVMDANVADIMKVGDKVTGNCIASTSIITVGAVNPDGDNVKEFEVSEGISASDGVTLSFSNQRSSSPTVVSGAGSVTGAGTIVLSANQTLENGRMLTFPGASTVATITGFLKVNSAGNKDVTLRFDLERFLTMH